MRAFTEGWLFGSAYSTKESETRRDCVWCCVDVDSAERAKAVFNGVCVCSVKLSLLGGVIDRERLQRLTGGSRATDRRHLGHS